MFIATNVLCRSVLLESRKCLPVSLLYHCFQTSYKHVAKQKLQRVLISNVTLFSDNTAQTYNFFLCLFPLWGKELSLNIRFHADVFTALCELIINCLYYGCVLEIRVEYTVYRF